MSDSAGWLSAISSIYAQHQQHDSKCGSTNENSKGHYWVELTLLVRLGAWLWVCTLKVWLPPVGCVHACVRACVHACVHSRARVCLFVCLLVCLLVCECFVMCLFVGSFVCLSAWFIDWLTCARSDEALLPEVYTVNTFLIEAERGCRHWWWPEWHDHLKILGLSGGAGCWWGLWPIWKCLEIASLKALRS